MQAQASADAGVTPAHMTEGDPTPGPSDSPGAAHNLGGQADVATSSPKLLQELQAYLVQPIQRKERGFFLVKKPLVLYYFVAKPECVYGELNPIEIFSASTQEHELEWLY